MSAALSSGPRVPFLVATGLSVAAGLLCSLAFPPAELWPLAFLAPAVLLLLLRDARPARGFALGLLFGLGFFGATLYWIWRFGTLAWFALTSVSALAVAIFGALLPAVSRPGATIRNAAGAAALWTVIDWIRGAWPLGGFTWGSLGISQVDNRALLPLASVTGVWGVTFVVVAAASLLADAAGGGAGLRRAGRAGLAVVLVVAPALIPFPRADGPALDVAALQVDVRVGAATSSAAEDLTVARRLVALERTLIGGARPDLVVWGEGSLDPAASADPATVSAVRRVIRAVGAPTSIGAVVNDADGPQRTTDLVFDPEGALVDRYDKVHLVPFGEYVPWRRWLGWVQAIGQIPVDRTPGTGVHTVVAPGLPPFATPICFENAFPALTRAFARDGATFFVVPVNNASYGFTAASDQHLQMSRMRAVETGRWFVDAAVSGVSAFIDPAGQVTERTELYQTTVMRGTVQSSSAPTWYVRLGDWVPWLALVAAIGLFLAPPRPRGMRRRSAVAPAGAPRTLVVLPTYEERHTIETVVSRVLALPEHVDIVVVDDSSPDGTGQVVRAIAAVEPRVRLIERPVKSGLGSAYLEGFRLALDEGYDLGVEMDSDLSHDPAELSRLLDAARGEGLVVGSRYVPGGSVSNWSRPRVWLSRAGNAYARLMLGVPIHDATSGYRAYRRDLLEDLLTRPMTSDGYGFQIELVMRAHLGGFAVGEVPITFREREHGRSKISRRIVVEALWSVTRWGMALRFGREPGAPKGEPPSKTGARDRRSAAGVL